MLDFKINTKNLIRKYLVIERHMLQIQDILFQLADISLTNFRMSLS